MNTRTTRPLAAAIAVLASLALAPGLVPAGGAFAASGASEAAAPPCHAGDLKVRLGRLDSGMSQRYQDVILRNRSGHPCHLGGTPTFRWTRGGVGIGWYSAPEGTPSRFRLTDGQALITSLHWVTPGVMPREDCHPRTSDGFTMTLPSRPHVWRFATAERKVCTSKQYRPGALALSRLN